MKSKSYSRAQGKKNVVAVIDDTTIIHKEETRGSREER